MLFKTGWKKFIKKHKRKHLNYYNGERSRSSKIKTDDMLLKYDSRKNLVYFLCLNLKVKVTWTYSYKRSIILTMTYAKTTFLLQKLNRYFTSSKRLFSCSLHMVFTQWYNTLFIYIIIWIVNLIVYARTKVATSQNTLPIHFCLPHLSATTFYKDHICLKKEWTNVCDFSLVWT